jgi:hypothetical protein
MKSAKIILSIVAIVITTTSAFASRINHQEFQYFYISGSNCLRGPVLEFECPVSGAGCMMDVGEGNIQQ